MVLFLPVGVATSIILVDSLAELAYAADFLDVEEEEDTEEVKDTEDLKKLAVNENGLTDLISDFRNQLFFISLPWERQFFPRIVLPPPQSS